MEVGQMQRRLLEYTKSLFMEGVLDNQFLQLQQLQDESNPDFVAEVVSLFFADSERLLNDLTRVLIGAERIKNACVAFRNFCEEQNIEGCMSCLQQVKQEYCLVKNKLETLFRMEQQIVAAGGSIPMMELSF